MLNNSTYPHVHTKHELLKNIKFLQSLVEFQKAAELFASAAFSDNLILNKKIILNFPCLSILNLGKINIKLTIVIEVSLCLRTFKNILKQVVIGIALC